jgi:hypothetical protein
MIPLCPSCLKHELNSWINEKIPGINAETAREIREAISSIALEKGECIVCKSNRVSSGLFEDVMKVLNKNKVNENLKKEFKKIFSFSIL